MNNKLFSLRINSSRLRADFDALAQFGATGDGGVHRPTFSDAHLAARAWFRAQIEKAGLEFRADGAGNHSALFKGAIQSPTSNLQFPTSRTLLLGSHLDSVPNGGRFDGALGVCAALEVLRVIKENRVALTMNLEAIDFTDEEGTLVGFLGSTSTTGKLSPDALRNPRGGRANLEAGLARAGLTEPGLFTAARPRESFGGYLELHIEQGKRLIHAQKQIGIVTNIVGVESYRVKFIGRADHAGSTPMDERRDAAQGASAFALAAREILLRDFPHCVANVGKMEFAPGAFNIVPSSVVTWLEFRAPTAEEFARLDAALIARAKLEAERFGLQIEIEFIGKHAPTPMSERAQRAFADACDDLGLSRMTLISGAAHDGMHLADVCPVGMIFVPSVEGASHAPRELTEWDDCVNGANVLLHAALRFAAR
ncbi:MAG: Zn-dependent hydrolase [Chloroflexi bacterium]|nr:Zn-dependent hydrolase [Chloroflexota bacterium]